MLNRRDALLTGISDAAWRDKTVLLENDWVE